MSGGRFEFDGTVDHRDGQQFVNGRRFFNDGFTRIHRIETSGFASVPIAGAKGLLLSPNGDPGQAYVLGLEHPAHRPDIPQGATAIYDHSGNIVKLVGTGITISSGGVTMVISPAGVEITGGTITHNGKDIGATHRHGGVVEGNDDTDVPV
jgi:phage gp45-like